ncbi:MAG: T9SS type A sorting domain-containing protein [Chitinophagales bacterium]|nr:T9SS type A sorting domain-containing protein [Chitinophagales bacterium]
MHGITIRGNIFHGPTGVTISTGTAINSIDADFILDPYCNANPQPYCSTYNRNHFSNLARGVYALVYDASKISRQLKIDRNDFVSVRRGIYLSAYNTPIVTRNHWQFGLGLDTCYMLYTSACHLYTIEEDTAVGASQAKSYGIIISESGELNNEVAYRNYFENLRYGAVSRGFNANDYFASIPIGLVFRCNEFHNVNFCIAAFRKQGSSLKQTIKRKQGGISDPVGNRFYNIPGGGYSFWSDANSTIIYYHHSNTPYLPSAGLTVGFSPYNTGISGDGASCPSHFGEQQQSSQRMLSSMNQSSNTQDSLLAFIDGGNKQSLLDKINNLNVTSSDLKQSLVEPGPYLSDSVLLAATTREQPMADADIKSVILTNSPTTDTIYNALEEEKPVVADNIVVVNAQNGISARDILESEMGIAGEDHDQTLKQLLTHYNDVEQSDSAFNILVDGNENLLALPKAIHKNDYATSAILIDALPKTNDDDLDLKNYYSLMVDQHAQGASMYELDSSQVDGLELSASQNSETGYLVLNLLSHVKRISYEEELPEITDDGMRIADEKNVYTLSGIPLFIFPNPANDQLIIQPNFIMQETLPVQISFYNSIGNKTFSFGSTLTPQGININIVDLPNGIYLCMVQHVTEQWQQTVVVQH